MFAHNNKAYALPPTCEIRFGQSLQFVRCTYRITLHVNSFLHRRASFLTKNDRLILELNCRPRPRPSRPILSNHSFLDTVKCCPEEWVQLPKVIHGSYDSALICDLFAPSVGAFSVTDTIPFHLQLSGTPSAIDSVFHPSHPASNSAARLPIRVHLLRCVTMDAGDRKATRRIVLGEGALRPLRPPPPGAGDCIILNWEGEVRCQDSTTVGSFDAGAVSAIV
ncbi:hypothetical protein B0H10DRAFT_2314352 [Mycena sp. CBHHK59/15]|nr:hypothetical protein B0H10DRAFT_2314352 [Mycena sp. CBHHK59/15]